MENPEINMYSQLIFKKGDRQSNGIIIFSINGAGTNDIHMSNEFGCLPRSTHKSELKMDYRPKVKIIKIHRRKHTSKLQDLRLNNDFLDMTAKEQ